MLNFESKWVMPMTSMYGAIAHISLFEHSDEILGQEPIPPKSRERRERKK
jgi:hypothetical protein